MNRNRLYMAIGLCVALLGFSCARPQQAAAMNQEMLEALQALRLMGAVQIAHFSTKGGYASPEELKKAELLDPQWPRVNPERYRVSCEAGRESFVCYADAVQAGDAWLRIDDSQKLRSEPDRRPAANSPLQVIPRKGGKL